MDEDFLDVTENSHKTGISFFLIVVAIAVCGYFFVFRNYHFALKMVEVELGSEVPTDVQYYIKRKTKTEDFKLDVSKVNPQEVGEYTYTVKSGNITKKGKIKVVDTTAPTFTTKDVTVEVGQVDFFLGDFLESCEDYSAPCLVTFKNAKDEDKLNVVGDYSIEIIVADTRGNKAPAVANLKVVEKGSLVDENSKDLEYASNSLNIDNFNGTVFKKLDKAVLSGSDEESDLLAEVSSVDLDKYVRDNYDGTAIKDTTIIMLYNKSGYTIGFSIQVALNDGRIVYVEPNRVSE